MVSHERTEHEQVMLDSQKSECYKVFVEKRTFTHWLLIGSLVFSLFCAAVGWNIERVSGMDKNATAGADKRMALVEAKSLELEKNLGLTITKFDQLNTKIELMNRNVERLLLVSELRAKQDGLRLPDINKLEQ